MCYALLLGMEQCLRCFAFSRKSQRGMILLLCPKCSIVCLTKSAIYKTFDIIESRFHSSTIDICIFYLSYVVCKGHIDSERLLEPIFIASLQNELIFTLLKIVMFLHVPWMCFHFVKHACSPSFVLHT